ncbi:leucine-rich repeat-containing protein 72 isoform X1 [Phascolarctos cinereus]|uniref:Leucine-rich repeat-containing protein 72 isoform X1 n=1 Tax=Phascolarctos cinereus TaxID=38626 RepID=A0A6P5LCN0_PHACI|nr:leucine-rich repeat-containing protein 72 isoform X1 [Phascolarctos cinereus]
MTQEASGTETVFPSSLSGQTQWVLETSSTLSLSTTPQHLRRDSSVFLTPISLCSSQGRAGRFRTRTPVPLALRRIATTENADVAKPSEADLSREKSLKAVEEQKKLCGHRRDIDVLELFLSRKGLVDVIDLAKFCKLKYLWLSFNKLQDIRFLLRNPCLVELYLDNNSLYKVEGLRHLVSLNVLMLHNNQLKNLDAIVDEMKLMNNLKILNLYRNPLSQDAKQYRMYTVYHLPSLWLLDRKEITLAERKTAIHMFNHERSQILQAIAFGRKVDKAPVVVPYEPRPTEASGTVEPTYLCRNLFHNEEDAVFVRSMKRSVTQFNFVDWDIVPTRAERHCESKAERPAEWTTVTIR